MKKVLIIEDGVEYRKLWKEFFEKAGAFLDAEAEIVEEIESPESLGLLVMEKVAKGYFVITDNDLSCYGFRELRAMGEKICIALECLGFGNRVAMSTAGHYGGKCLSLGKGDYTREKLFLVGSLLLSYNPRGPENMPEEVKKLRAECRKMFSEG